MKKLLFRAILGFSLGITLLMVAYLGIYYIAGQELFDSVILRLSDVTVFQNQLLVVGFAGIMMAFAIHIIENTLVEDKYSPSIAIFSIIALLLSLSISMLLIKNIGAFDEALVDMLIIISTILFALYCLLHCIQETVDEFIINKKIKEKNG